MTQMFGTMKSEKLAAERKTAHQITQEILNFGTNDNIIANIIYNLALNVEDIKTSQHLASAVKEIMPGAFITSMSQQGEGE